MRYTILILILSFGLSYGQTTADFEDQGLGVEEFNNGSDGSGGFNSGNIFLSNDYDAGFDAWTGWSMSSMTDITTPGFMNQYSAITAGGHDGSNSYAVGFSFEPLVIELTGDALGRRLSGFYYTNSTYAYLSMRDGDAFAKQFNAEDDDFFYVTIKAFYNGALSSDSLNIYLADFTFINEDNNYILDTWRYADLSSFGKVDSLQLSFTSTDVGAFGINTPTYICVDNIETLDLTNVEETSILNAITINPNPARDYINVAHKINNTSYRIVSMDGKECARGIVRGPNIDISHLEDGIYSLILDSGKNLNYGRFIKIK